MPVGVWTLDNAVHSCQLRETGRQKQAIRVNLINQSNLRIRVLVREEAESLAQQIVPEILQIVSSGNCLTTTSFTLELPLMDFMDCDLQTMSKKP
jgi:hypothetical protein